MIEKAKVLLDNVFGYRTFRPLQQAIIESVLNKHDALVIMPTGGGKSLCYQIPALLFPGLTVVVSPLISLMKDQVEQLQALDVAAVCLNSSLSPEVYRQNVARLRSGQVKLLYLAPEALLRPHTLELLAACHVDCFTIDEAHCISEWGHDFRPEYRQLNRVRARFPKAVAVALTATATPRVRSDIQQSLNLDDASLFLASFDRENLFLEVADKVDPTQQTIAFLKKFPDQSGIVYCFSRRQVDELSAELGREGFSVRPYHAGLGEAERSDNQERFIRDDVQIVVATVAFGMGINKPNVRFVVHYDLPKNIESYYQEIGRAGRDGQGAHCLLLFSYADVNKVKYFINQKSPQEQRVANQHLDALLGLAETEVCRRRPLLHYFGETYEVDNCGMCDNCTTEKKPGVDLSVSAQKFLSCVKRTGELFGAGHIVDVLRGSESQKIIKFKHHRLSTHGIGLEHSKKQWLQLSRQFVQQGLLSSDAQYGSLKLTKKAYAVMRGQERVTGRLKAEAPSAPRASNIKSALAYDRALFETLRQQRKALADELGVPPYVVFSDRTLIEMAYYFPQSTQELLGIHGVGEAKAKRFGAVFLEHVKAHCASHPVAPRARPQPDQRPSQQTGRKHEHTAQAFNAGKSILQLASELSIKPATVVSHLQKYAQEGHTLRAEGLLEASNLDPKQQQRVFELFRHLGAARLTPTFEALEGQVSYDELRVLQLYWLNRGDDLAQT